MPTALPQGTAEKLAKVLARLGSDYAGERAAAGLLAHRIIRDNSVTWEDLVLRPVLSPPHTATRRTRPQTGPSQHIGKAQWALARAVVLSDWEKRFLGSLMQWRGSPTDRQQVTLDDIVRKVERATKQRWAV